MRRYPSTMINWDNSILQQDPVTPHWFSNPDSSLETWEEQLKWENSYMILSWGQILPHSIKLWRNGTISVFKTTEKTLNTLSISSICSSQTLPIIKVWNLSYILRRTSKQLEMAGTETDMTYSTLRRPKKCRKYQATNKRLTLWVSKLISFMKTIRYILLIAFHIHIQI